MSQLNQSLNDAINNADLQAVQALMAQGANPWERVPGQDSAAQLWAKSQHSGNPHATAMAQALFERLPQNPQERQVLDEITLSQMSNLARALGVAEKAIDEGADPSQAWVGAQTLDTAQCNWALVRKAYGDTYDKDPMFDVNSYANAYAHGVAQARAFLVPMPGGLVARSPLQEVYVNPEFAAQVANRMQAAAGAGRAITVLPKGNFAPPAIGVNQPASYFCGLNTVSFADKHHAAVFRADSMEERIKDHENNTLNGLDPKAWHAPSPLERLNEALEQKDWKRAEFLVEQGSHLGNKLDINALARSDFFTNSGWLGSTKNVEEAKMLLKLGADPWKAVPSGMGNSGYTSLPIDRAQDQAHFDFLLTEMKARRPDMGIYKPNSYKNQEFYKNSPHFVDERGLGEKAFDAVVDGVVTGLSNLMALRKRRDGGPEAVADEADKPKNRGMKA